MSSSLLITGGARSGKSSFAEKRTLSYGTPVIYIATAQAFDEEMENRIQLHQQRRGDEWRTISEPLAIANILTSLDRQGACLVDCLTLWLSNLIFAEEDISKATSSLIEAIATRRDPVILVTNEVGGGIVPENALARRFRDEAGRLNQIVAEAVDEVYTCISGIPLKLKP
ncbi:MAG: bifunctional adenosylcobinamide kinase/adenosylcobinamide-phosphate guanylyltransferase [Alphaproteobacteria bacterium]|jgi:adenosylcobinamide kinase / adenosylcobinamide-phosphate guanylyltransferase|nr:bifunctional adenosylcobinamide kinase/adenosylcobinamide-phosphate guanylyltransferase [Alphaproteobacteria bacterium]